MTQYVLMQSTRIGSRLYRTGQVFDTNNFDIRPLQAAGAPLVLANDPGIQTWLAALQKLQHTKGSFDQQDPGYPLLPSMLNSVPTSLQTDWYIDPINGIDSAPATSNQPIQTWAEFQRRIASIVVFNDLPGLNIHWLNDQQSTNDPVTMLMVAHDTPITMTGSLIQVTTGSFTAVTNISRSIAQQTTGTVGNSNPTNYWTQYLGMLVHDTTQDTWFVVDKDLGNRTAQFTRPFHTAITSNFLAAPSGLGSIAASDQFVIYRYPKVHLGLNFVQPYSSTGVGTVPTLVFQHIHFFTEGDVGVVAANLMTTDIVMFLECLFDGAVILRSYPEEGIAINCYFNNGVILDGFLMVGGGCSFVTMINESNIDGDAIIHGSAEIWGSNSIGLAYFDNSTYDIPFSSLQPPMFGQLSISTVFSFYSSSAFWGPAQLRVHSNGRVLYDGSATTQLLHTGGTQIEGLSTAAKMTPGSTRVIADSISITTTNIDDTTGGKVAGMVGSKLGIGGIYPFV